MSQPDITMPFKGFPLEIIIVAVIAFVMMAYSYSKEKDNLKKNRQYRVKVGDDYGDIYKETNEDYGVTRGRQNRRT